ncbi:uncharacterized protein LOC144238566 [Crocuta crocuta]
MWSTDSTPKMLQSSLTALALPRTDIKSYILWDQICFPAKTLPWSTVLRHKVHSKPLPLTGRTVVQHSVRIEEYIPPQTLPDFNRKSKGESCHLKSANIWGDQGVASCLLCALKILSSTLQHHRNTFLQNFQKLKSLRINKDSRGQLLMLINYIHIAEEINLGWGHRGIRFPAIQLTLSVRTGPKQRQEKLLLCSPAQPWGEVARLKPHRCSSGLSRSPVGGSQLETAQRDSACGLIFRVVSMGRAD